MYGRQELLFEWSREGPSYRQSSVHGFSDEAFHISDPLGTEVLSEVDEMCSLPDDFNQSEVKFSRVKGRFLSRQYDFQRRRWEAQFQHIRIYIIDPKKLLGIQRLTHPSQEDLASKTMLHLDPAGWHFFYPLMIDGLQFDLYDFNGWDQFREASFRMAKNKKGRSLSNVRRQVLKSQALHADLMHIEPIQIEGSTYGFDPLKRQPDIRSLAVPQTSRLMFDQGHSGDLRALESRLDSFRKRFKRAEKYYSLPRPKASNLDEGSSASNELLQLADMAAGYAKFLYEGPKSRDELPKLFKDVYVNGIRM